MKYGRKFLRLFKAGRYNMIRRVACRDFDKGKLTEDEWLDVMDRAAWAYVCRKYPSMER